MKRAFTLIELLVVIAIIAILAAILFPVFAQAKDSAKDTSNLSNLKQTGLSVLMYCADYDDVLPLAQRYEPSYTALFGLATWQTEVQPYMKNWGILLHPKNPALPENAAFRAWQQTLHYGVVPRAENLKGTPMGTNGYWAADPGVGSFARRVCGNLPCRYTGMFGNGCAQAGSTTQCPWWGSASSATAGGTTPSLSTTAVASVAETLMVSEGAMWDLWMGYGIDNICTYGVMWTPLEYNLSNSSDFNMACPHARKRPKKQSPDGTCSRGDCSGIGNGIQNGFTTYVAADGHAIASDYRGKVMAQATLPNGTIVVKSMWPQGGW